VEADFERLKGVVSAVSGYAGGNVRNPNYEMVHEGITGHAEVVMVQYDPKIISYEDLLKIFWSCHDPTTLNRQGPDVGTQYRSIILYHNEDQRKAALKSYQQLVDARVFRSPIVTQLAPLKAFYRAEDEHQDYYGGKPRASSRRRTTSAAKSKKSQSKVAKALSAKPEAEAAEAAKPGDVQGGDAKPAGEQAGAKDSEPKP
jgi:peptide-methionine (S)-S-oxide reductase